MSHDTTVHPFPVLVSPKPSLESAALIAVIDQALGDHWSFDLVHHEVVGDETIVFTRLIVDGRHRIGIGSELRLQAGPTGINGLQVLVVRTVLGRER